MDAERRTGCDELEVCTGKISEEILRLIGVSGGESDGFSEPKVAKACLTNRRIGEDSKANNLTELLLDGSSIADTGRFVLCLVPHHCTRAKPLQPEALTLPGISLEVRFAAAADRVAQPR